MSFLAKICIATQQGNDQYTKVYEMEGGKRKITWKELVDTDFRSLQVAVVKCKSGKIS